METQVKVGVTSSEFSQGSPVIYGLHGKCKVSEVVDRTVGGTSLRLYKLEFLKSPFSRSHRQEAAIWVPVTSARTLGLRMPIDENQAKEVLAVLNNKESYFNIFEPWATLHPKLETLVKNEGAIGLAKAYSFLVVQKRKGITQTTELTKFFELIHRLLFRELSETLGEATKTIEEKLTKALKAKTAIES